MTNKEMQCPKCKGEMVQGFVPDHFQAARSFVVAWFARPTEEIVLVQNESAAW
jgi:uncharacterized protein involved in propanediol utilization